MPALGETEALLSDMSLWYERTIDVKIIFHNPNLVLSSLDTPAHQRRRSAKLSLFHSFICLIQVFPRELLTNWDSSRESATAIYFWLPLFLKCTIQSYSLQRYLIYTCFFQKEFRQHVEAGPWWYVPWFSSSAWGRQTSTVQLATGCAQERFGGWGIFYACLGPSPIDQSYSTSELEKLSERYACLWGNCHF